jgi:uncharacterized phage protein (TIGR01671 family)
MTRPIKFRAWDKKTQNMVYIFPNADAINSPIFGWMQFTGLLDKLGKEIYEGDIIKLEQWVPTTYEVLFDRGGFCFRVPGRKVNDFYNDCKYLEDSEVIGNIWENGELIK